LQPKCNDENDCKGKDEKCTAGDHKGCSCKSCPTGDKQPKCNDDKISKGKHKKCTIGDNKGCDCKEEPCPQEQYTPFCDFCGDKGGDGKCKGLSDINNLWAGCKCQGSPPDPVPWPPMPQDVLKFDPDTLPSVSHSSHPYGGDDPLKCQTLKQGAKQSDLKRSISDWCKSVDGKTVSKTGSGVLYKRFDYNGYSYWLGAQYDGKSGGNCGDSATYTRPPASAPC
jgi:hypothetical protein